MLLATIAFAYDHKGPTKTVILDHLLRCNSAVVKFIRSIPSFEKEGEELEQKVDSPPNFVSNQVNSQPE